MSVRQRITKVDRIYTPWWSASALREICLKLTRGTPEQRYQRRVLQRIARGDRLATLGAEIRDEADVRAASERWLQHLVKLGLGPDHLCVEYGCGSLWCAEPVIRH